MRAISARRYRAALKISQVPVEGRPVRRTGRAPTGGTDDFRRARFYRGHGPLLQEAPALSVVLRALISGNRSGQGVVAKVDRFITLDVATFMRQRYCERGSRAGARSYR
jgi:hypothetical protein